MNPKFAVQAGLSFTVIFFCMDYILSGAKENQTIAWSVVTGTIGFWLPSPEIDN